MAKIELLDEQPLNITMSEPQTINETIAPQENINVETTDGWYERSYTETDPVYSRSAASSITEQDIESWDNKSNFSGDYNDLENKPELFSGDYDDLENKPDIPTKTSQLTNDSGFLTEHQDISGKADKSEIPTKVSELTNDSGYITSYTETDPTVPAHVKNITSTDITNWNNKSTFSGSYTDLTDKPTIPSKTSDLSNDSGFIDNTVNDLTNYSLTTSIQSNKNLTRGIEYIVGAQVSATNLWTGVSTDTGCSGGELYIGKTIIYHLPVAGTSTAATLNLTLPDNSTTGAKNIYRLNNTTVTTTFAAGCDILMVYDGTQWKINAYVDTNTNTIGYQLRTNSAIWANKTGYSTNRYTLLFEVDGGLSGAATTIATGTSKTIVSFKYIPYGVIKYNTTNASVANGSNIAATGLWDQYVFDLRYTFNIGSTLTSGKPVYMRCSINADGTISPNYSGSPSHPIVQDLPTTSDGYVYVFLGQAYSTTNIELMPSHPIYEYKGGKIRLWQYDNTITVDSALSSSSENPVQNKVINSALDSKQDEITSANKLDYSLIDNTPTIPTVPTNLSSFTDDLGSSPIHTHSQYLISHQDISGKVDKETGKGLSSNDFTTTYKNNVDSNTAARHTHSNKTVLDGISSSDITNWNNKSTFSGDYDDLTNKPTIPSKTSDLTNDSGFLTNSYHDSSKQDSLVSGTNIKTINSQSLLGSGDISFDTIQEISGESSIRIKNLDGGIYKIYGETYGTDLYYNSNDSLMVADRSYAYLIVTEDNDIQTVRHWVYIGNLYIYNEVCYGYSWLSHGYCYNVTSAEEQAAITGILSNLTTTAKTNLVSAINELDSDKQDTLVSGTNIKTINNQSILGSGNISLPTSSDIPTKTSDLINDSGYIIGIKDVIGVSKTSATTVYSTNKQGFLPFISSGSYSIDAQIGTSLTWTTKSVSFEDMTGTTYGISIPSGVSLVKVETNVRYQNSASSQININTMIFRDRNGTSTSARAMSQSVPGSSRYTCNFATYISVQEGDFIYIGSWKSTASANVSVSEVDNATGVMLEIIQ